MVASPEQQFREVGDVRGEANCIYGLGNIARRRSDHEDARTQYERALALYWQTGSVLGEAKLRQEPGRHRQAQRS